MKKISMWLGRIERSLYPAKEDAAALSLLTVREACGKLEVGRLRLYRMIWKGELDWISAGARLLIPEGDVERYIAEREGGQAT